MQTPELVTKAEELGLTNVGRMTRKDIIYNILKSQAKGGDDIFGEGVLQIIPDIPCDPDDAIDVIKNITK